MTLSKDASRPRVQFARWNESALACQRPWGQARWSMRMRKSWAYRNEPAGSSTEPVFERQPAVGRESRKR